MGEQNNRHLRPSRRGFVGLVGEGAAIFALGGLIHTFGGKEGRIIRPPGALPEEEFLSRCIRCDKCRLACPYNIVIPIPITESILNAGTPKLNGWCPNCRRCIPVCPTGALRVWRGY